MKALVLSFKWEYLKWIQSIKIGLVRAVTYKMDFLFTTTVPLFLFFFIKYNLWTSVYSVNGASSIQGYSLKEMIVYQIWILIFDICTRSRFFSVNLSESIRLGRISAFLLYPFGFIKYQCAGFLSERIIQFLNGLLIFSVCLFFGFLSFSNPLVLLKALVFVFAVAGFWFLSQMAIGLLAFWFEETWSLNLCVRFLVIFFSGSFLPLELYPEVLRRFLEWTPFPYLAYFPVALLMGREVSFVFGLLVLCFWLVLLGLLVRYIWRKGLVLYAGSGI